MPTMMGFRRKICWTGCWRSRRRSFHEIRDWAKSPAPLLRVRVNISAQWLIGRFVRVLHSKSDLINCAGVGRRTLFFIWSSSFPLPLHVFLVTLSYDSGSSKLRPCKPFSRWIWRSFSGVTSLPSSSTSLMPAIW